jgi:hypothetical protein
MEPHPALIKGATAERSFLHKGVRRTSVDLEPLIATNLKEDTKDVKSTF